MGAKVAEKNQESCKGFLWGLKSVQVGAVIEWGGRGAGRPDTPIAGPGGKTWARRRPRKLING